jgi:hypothetical protein
MSMTASRWLALIFLFLCLMVLASKTGGIRISSMLYTGLSAKTIVQ